MISQYLPVDIANSPPWLKDLTEKKYIAKIFKRSWTENTLPAKYYISLQGIKFLKTQLQCTPQYLKKLYKEKYRSQTFINRCLFIAQVYLLFLSQMGRRTQSCKFYTQSDYKPDSLIRDISPDFVIIEREKFYHLYQIFYKKTPRYAIRNKIKQYQQFFEHEGKDLNARVIYICPEKSYAYTKNFMENYLKENDIEFEIKVTTKNNIINKV